MRASRHIERSLAFAVFVATLLLPLAAAAQTPMPGETPELSRPWTFWLAIPIALGALGLLLLIGVSYAVVSRRFYGKEEPPKPAPARQYAGVNAPAFPAPAAAAPSPTPRAAARTPTPAAAQPAPAQQAAAPAASPMTEAAKEPEPKVAPAEEPEAKPAAKEAAEPADEAKKPAAKAAAKPDDDVYQRVLKEQLDKGVSPRVAEGRAKAAAHKAARQQAGAG